MIAPTHGVVVVYEADDLGAGVGSADTEVQHAAGVAEADLSVAVDGVVADAPEVGVDRGVGIAFGISW